MSRVEAARDAVTLWLARIGTRRAPAPYLAGQFVTLALPRPNGGSVHRSYSLCGDGDPSQPWEITIKRQAGGLVSPYLCDTLQPGMVFKTSMPTGTFVLPRPVDRRRLILLVATGSGITPMVGLVRALARMAPDARPPVHLHYAYHSPEDGIYVRELLALDPEQRWLRQWHYVSTRGDRLTPAHVRAPLGADVANAEVYYCGNRMLRTVLESDLRQYGVRNVHVETFLSPRATSAATSQSMGTGARVRLAESGAVIATLPGETLLDALERNGYASPSSCRAGACGTCRLKVLSGRVRDHGDALTQRERHDGYVLSCVAQPVGDVTVTGVGRPSGGRRPGQVAAANKPTGAITLMRGALLTASIGFFIGAGHSIYDLAAHTSSSAVPAANSNASGSVSNSGSTSSSSGDDGSNGNTSSPSGPSSIHNGSSNFPSNSSSGVS